MLTACLNRLLVNGVAPSNLLLQHLPAWVITAHSNADHIIIIIIIQTTNNICLRKAFSHLSNKLLGIFWKTFKHLSRHFRKFCSIQPENTQCFSVNIKDFTGGALEQVLCYTPVCYVVHIVITISPDKHFPCGTRANVMKPNTAGNEECWVLPYHK